MPKSEICTFKNSLGETFAAAQKSIRDLGYKMDSIDKQNGLLNFKTGLSMKSWAGQEMSVMLIEIGNGSVEVSISGRMNQARPVQVFDWGEASGIAHKVFDRMRMYLNVNPQANRSVPTQISLEQSIRQEAEERRLKIEEDRKRREAEKERRRNERNASYISRGVDPGPFAWYHVLPDWQQAIILGLTFVTPLVIGIVVLFLAMR